MAYGSPISASGCGLFAGTTNASVVPVQRPRHSADIVEPTVTITNKRPTLTIVSVRFFGARHPEVPDLRRDVARNLTILATDSRPGRVSQTRRFSTRITPDPCGVYSRNWVPAPRFRGKGRYATATLQARDTSGLTSAPARPDVNR